MSAIEQPLVGTTRVPASDATEVPFRLDRTGAMVVQHAHGEMYEETARGNVWTISTAVAGVGIVTAIGVITTASNNPIVGLYNPSAYPGGVNLHVTRCIVVPTTGTAVTGGFIWGIQPNPTGITSSGISARNNKTFAKGGHIAIAFDGSIPATGQSVASSLLRPFGGSFAGALAAGTNETLEETETDLVVGPGAFLGLYTNVVATGLNVVASLSWAEVPT